VARTKLPGRAHGRRDIDATGAAEEKSLAIQKSVDGLDDLGIGNRYGGVDRCPAQVGRDPANPDPFSDGAGSVRLQLAGCHPVEQRTALRVGQHDPDGRCTFLQEPADPAERAARSGGRDECMDLAARVTDDLRSGRRVMAFAVGDVVELVGPDRPGQLGAEPPRDALVVIIVGVRHRLDLAHVRTEGL
jgi:hypothetical protein